MRGEVGLTPGSNLTPKSRHDSMDPFMTDEQRRKVIVKFKGKEFQYYYSLISFSGKICLCFPLIPCQVADNYPGTTETILLFQSDTASKSGQDKKAQGVTVLLFIMHFHTIIIKFILELYKINPSETVVAIQPNQPLPCCGPFLCLLHHYHWFSPLI